PAHAFREAPMNIIAIQNVWFDDAATLAMGEAFDRACKSLGNLGSAVPEIIAYLIIKAAKTGERDPARLYEQVLNAFSIEDMSMPVVSVGSDLPVLRFGHARSVIIESSVRPEPGSRLGCTRILGLLILKRRLILKLFGARRVGFDSASN
ncbi:MAG: hypothetical protein WA478_02375, partial [Pseudolabrys sp.]